MRCAVRLCAVGPIPTHIFIPKRLRSAAGFSFALPVEAEEQQVSDESFGPRLPKPHESAGYRRFWCCLPGAAGDASRHMAWSKWQRTSKPEFQLRPGSQSFRPVFPWGRLHHGRGRVEICRFGTVRSVEKTLQHITFQRYSQNGICCWLP